MMTKKRKILLGIFVILIAFAFLNSSNLVAAETCGPGDACYGECEDYCDWGCEDSFESDDCSNTVVGCDYTNCLTRSQTGCDGYCGDNECQTNCEHPENKYNCNNDCQDCSSACDSWTKKSCGEDGNEVSCGSCEVLYTRTCSRHGCDEEKCVEENNFCGCGGGGGGCSDDSDCSDKCTECSTDYVNCNYNDECVCSSSSNDYKCPTGECSDPDGPAGYDTRTTVEDKNGKTESDWCDGSDVIELSCGPNGFIQDESHTCPNGCKNGACKTGGQDCKKDSRYCEKGSQQFRIIYKGGNCIEVFCKDRDQDPCGEWPSGYTLYRSLKGCQDEHGGGSQASCGEYESGKKIRPQDVAHYTSKLSGSKCSRTRKCGESGEFKGTAKGLQGCPSGYYEDEDACCEAGGDYCCSSDEYKWENCDCVLKNEADQKCDPKCENGGECLDDNTCDCFGTGYKGDHCQTPYKSTLCEETGGDWISQIDSCSCPSNNNWEGGKGCQLVEGKCEYAGGKTADPGETGWVKGMWGPECRNTAKCEEDGEWVTSKSGGRPVYPTENSCCSDNGCCKEEKVWDSGKGKCVSTSGRECSSCGSFEIGETRTIAHVGSGGPVCEETECKYWENYEECSFVDPSIKGGTYGNYNSVSDCCESDRLNCGQNKKWSVEKCKESGGSDPCAECSKPDDCPDDKTCNENNRCVDPCADKNIHDPDWVVEKCHESPVKCGVCGPCEEDPSKCVERKDHRCAIGPVQCNWGKGLSMSLSTLEPGEGSFDLYEGWNSRYIVVNKAISRSKLESRCSGLRVFSMNKNNEVERAEGDLKPGEAYLLRTDSDCRVILSADLKKKDKLKFSSGWNVNGAHITVPLDEFPDSCGTVYAFRSDGEELKTASELKAGRGYLVRTDNSCEVSLN